MKIVCIFLGGNESLFFRQAYAGIPQECGLYAEFYEAGELDRDESLLDECISSAADSDLLFISVHSGLPYFRSFEKLNRLFTGKIPTYIVSGVEDEITEMQKRSSLPDFIFEKAEKYRQYSGIENTLNMLLFLAREIGSADCMPAPPAPVRSDGIYGVAKEDEESFLENIREDKDTLIAGILFHNHSILHEDTAHIDGLIEAVKNNGAVPLPVYSAMAPSDISDGLNGVINKYFMHDGRTAIDVLITAAGHTLSFLADPKSRHSKDIISVFGQLDTAVLQAMYTFYDYGQWKESAAGLDSMLLCSNVYQPEFDGQLISAVVGYTETVRTQFGPKYRTYAIEDRCAKAAALAVNWGKLRKTANSQKKAAIVLHNMPPRADMIGCAYGLDTPQSVYNIIRTMQKSGIKTDYDFSDGKEIIDKITEALTNDNRFLSADEILGRCAVTLDESIYPQYFDAMPEKVRDELERDWGSMPGEFMCSGSKILVPGIVNGNIFIGLQPPRALEEKADEAYHSADIVCPYQYLAFYRYLECGFGADFIVHAGTHGTLEWLPGKEIGLSDECYPDIACGTLPNIYPYIIDVPGEGAQAKRRSAACVIDHLIPSMTESGVPGGLESIEEDIASFYHSKILGNGKEASAAESIWEKAEAVSLTDDIDLARSDFDSDRDAVIDRIHLWISDIKSTKIKDGLHIFGQVPSGVRYTNMIRLLVANKNGDIPDLRSGVLEVMGEDYEILMSDPSALRADGTTNAMTAEAADETGREIFESLAQKGFDSEGAESVINDIEKRFGRDAKLLRQCLMYAVSEIKQRLDRTGEELEYFERAFNGRFVPPGASGAPSRGNAEILPTGRNFYMTDPAAIPSRSAWLTGVRLGDQLLETYLKTEGRYPENVSIVVYSGETIKTFGDDIAEIMYLYGVKPVWIGSTNRVTGIELIPPEELGRPRIDVTLRISGLFRDTFPNLIEKIEDVVNLCASLDEPDEINYIKKHISEDVNELLKQGMHRQQAEEYASLRVFGCPPSNYGAGVDTLVNSRKWDSSDDLGRAYISWSSHAYSRKLHGEKLPGIFSSRLAQCDVTVKNIASYESDMLDDDDYYIYHGGLIAAVKSVSGNYPVSYSVRAGDPEHVKTLNIHEDISRIMRARITNPKWTEGQKQHGFKGAQEFSAMLDIVFGWDAASGAADDWMYEAIAGTYLFDDEMREWIKEANPYALHAMSGRLLEAISRGMWNADEQTKDMLRSIYLQAEGDLEGK